MVLDGDDVGMWRWRMMVGEDGVGVQGEGWREVGACGCHRDSAQCLTH